jgi:hypothetical protein
MRSFKIVLVVLFLSFTGFAFAQGGGGQQPPAGAPAQGQPPAGAGGMQQELSVDDETKSLATQLGLTADQTAKVLTILKEREEGILKVRKDFPVAKPGSSPSQEGVAAMGKVMNGARAKILSVLNDEQKKKYEATQSMLEQGGPQK